MKLKYRPDIDGLRAIAVISIVLFHLRFSYFGGGFVGVDIFFVISGYLITQTVYVEICTYEFSVLTFYERRIRRIVPALLVMLLVVSAVDMALAFPDEIKDYIPSLISSLFFASNIEFYRKSDYFASAADTRPLLHTWSLGIEEQFYIVLPWLILTIVRLAPRRITVWLGAVTFGSFILSVVLTRLAPSAAFYFLPTRAWELLVGALVGLGTVPRLERRWAVEAVGLGGMAAIGLAVFVIRPTMSFPAPVGALPVVGTALVLAYGDRARMIRPLLTNPIARFFGVISYSLYLWHWPIVVFMRMYGLIEAASLWCLPVLALATGLAWTSWRFVEQPFRDRNRFNANAVFRLAGIGAVVTCAYTGVMAMGHGWPDRFTRQQLELLAAHDDFSPQRKRCHITKGNPDPADACVLGGSVPHAAMWSDSHGIEMALALSETREPLLELTYSACGPALGWQSPDRPLCRVHNDRVMDYLVHAPDIRTVYIASNYATLDLPDYGAGIRRSVEGLLRAGKQVVVIGPTPAEGHTDLPNQMARLGTSSVSRRHYEQAQGPAIALMHELQAMGAQVWMPADVMCHQDSCALAVDGRPVLFDSHHLSMAGARMLAAGFPAKRQD